MRCVVMALLALTLTGTGCDDGKPTAGAQSSASGAASTKQSAQPKPTAAPVAKPQPLELASLKKALRCTGKAGSGPCPVLEKFEKCREGWSPITQSGDGRWLGQAAVVKKGQFIEEFYMMRAKRVGLAEVAPGQLGVKIALTEVPSDQPGLKTAAGKAYRALNRGDVAKRGNQAMQYVNERQDWPEAFAQQADRHQIFVAAGAGTYLCGDPESQALLAVALSGSREHPGDGIYVTLYPTKW